MADETEDLGIDTQDDAGAKTAAEKQPVPKVDDLEDILSTIKQYREETASPETTERQTQARNDGQRKAPAGDTGGKEVPAQTQFENDRIAKIEARIVSDDLSKAIGTIKGAQPALKTLGDGVVKAMLNDAAAADDRIRAAWMQRDANPVAFQRVLNGLARKFAADLPTPADGRVDGDRAAAITAARGSTRQPAADAEDKKVLGMSDAEFDRHWKTRARRSA